LIEIEITEKMKQTAWRKARAMGQLKKSITKGQGNISGFLGEVLVLEYLSAISKNTKDYDLIHEGLRYDVKTKRCTSEPKPNYDCSVAAYNTVQKCDRYIFVRIQQNKTTKKWEKAWILGWYDKEQYYLDSRYLRKGQRDGDNWFTVRANCYNVAIEELEDIEELL